MNSTFQTGGIIYRMSRPRKIFAVVFSLIVLALMMPERSMARAKQLVNGCSVEQIQSNFGQSCVDQMQQDLKNNKPYTHALLCNGSEKLCCTYDNATNQVTTCRKPAGTALVPGLRDPRLGLSGTELKTRGVEGADGGDEEAPAPAWMTEDRRKQLQQDSTAQ